MVVDPISHKTSMPGMSTHQGAVVSGAPAPTPEFMKALHEGAGKYGGTPITHRQVEAAAKYMHGKKGVDILKLADHVGISVGAADHLNGTRKEHFRNSGGSAPLNRAQMVNNYLKQTWIK